MLLMQSDLLFMRYKDDCQEFFGQQKKLLSGKSRVSNYKVVTISLNLENEGVGFSK